MRNLKIGGLATLTLAIVFVTTVVRVYIRFRRDLHNAHESLQKKGSQVVETECGPIEYATLGEGYPMLVVHGILGGFDQGIVVAGGNIGETYRSVIPSRFGYLRTPMPDDASPAAQADAFACLLDALGIQQTVVLGTSAGGTSAIQFALRYPERCAALVLFSSNAPGETETILPPEPLVKLVFKSDFIFWFLITYFRSTLNAMMGVPGDFELTPEHEATIAEVMKTILPVNPRCDGAVFDMFVSNGDINTGYPMGDIRVPVMIVNAVDDPLTLYVNAQSMAKSIHGAKLVTIESGGHMLLGHEKRIRSEIVTFLAESLGDQMCKG